MYQFEVDEHVKSSDKAKDHHQKGSKGIDQQNYPEKFGKSKAQVGIIRPTFEKELFYSMLIHIKIPPQSQ